VAVDEAVIVEIMRVVVVLGGVGFLGRLGVAVAGMGLVVALLGGAAAHAVRGKMRGLGHLASPKKWLNSRRAGVMSEVFTTPRGEVTL